MAGLFWLQSSGPIMRSQKRLPESLFQTGPGMQTTWGTPPKNQQQGRAILGDKPPCLTPSTATAAVAFEEGGNSLVRIAQNIMETSGIPLCARLSHENPLPLCWLGYLELGCQA